MSIKFRIYFLSRWECLLQYHVKILEWNASFSSYNNMPLFFSLLIRCGLSLIGISWQYSIFLVNFSWITSTNISQSLPKTRTIFSFFLFEKHIIKTPFKRSYQPWIDRFVTFKKPFFLFSHSSEINSRILSKQSWFEIGFLKAIWMCLFFRNIDICLYGKFFPYFYF